MTSFPSLADEYIVSLFRMTGFTFPDFLLGTFLLALACVVVGEISISVVFRINRAVIEHYTEQVLRFQNLSMDALERGNKAAYKATNELANEAFGRAFFMQIAMSAAFLWPLFFALGWMQSRFQGVTFEIMFTDRTVGVGCVFIALYIMAYIMFGKIKYKLPYFRSVKTILNEYNASEF